MFVIRFKKLFLSISFGFVALSIIAIAVFGLKPGIDFTGGSALTLSFADARPETSLVSERIVEAGIEDVVIQPVGENGISLKTRALTDNERANLISLIADGSDQTVTQENFTTIGPSVGKELKNKAIVALMVVFIAIICFVAYAFRKVSHPVSSWKYGFAVIFALMHDIIIPTGMFAVLGHVIGASVDTLFVVALLTTLALSVSDTIVVFDRIRENLGLKNEKGDLVNQGRPFQDIVGESLSQTFVRSINTSLMSLVTVVVLAFFGPASTTLFAVTLAVGMFFGIYSSVFMASPLLVLMGGDKRVGE